MFAIIESRMYTVQIANICELFVCQTTRPVSILELFHQVFSTRGRHAFRLILFRRTSIIILYCRRGKRRSLPSFTVHITHVRDDGNIIVYDGHTYVHGL